MNSYSNSPLASGGGGTGGRSPVRSLLDEDNDEDESGLGGLGLGLNSYDSHSRLPSTGVTGLESLGLGSNSGAGSEAMRRKLSPILVPSKVLTNSGSTGSQLSVATIKAPLPSPGAAAAKQFEDDDSWDWCR